MKFSRKATYKDFENEIEEWSAILHKDIRDEILNSTYRYRGVTKYRNLYCCGIEEAKRVVGRYISFLAALNDFQDGKDVYVEY